MVKFTHDGIRINGVERPLYSGSIHYWRTRKKDWRHVLSQIKGGGYLPVLFILEYSEINSKNTKFA